MMKLNTKAALVAITIGLQAVSAAAQAETGTWHRFKEYDIGNAGYVAPMNCMDMPCCAKMKAENKADCADMDCCKNMKMDEGACKKMLKSGKSR